MMGLKSNTTKGGSGYNEMAIVDGKAGELIRIHAQKDMDTTVLNNDTQYVVVDRTIRIDGKRDQTVKKDMSTKVSEGNQSNVVSTGWQSNTVKEAISITSESSSIAIRHESKPRLVSFFAYFVDSYSPKLSGSFNLTK